MSGLAERARMVPRWRSLEAPPKRLTQKIILSWLLLLFLLDFISIRLAYLVAHSK